jgi:hypothetical protein
MCQRRVVVKGTQATVRCRPPAFLLRSSVGMHWLGTLVLDRIGTHYPRLLQQLDVAITSCGNRVDVPEFPLSQQAC